MTIAGRPAAEVAVVVNWTVAVVAAA